jgi:hypothetical protein
VCVRGRAVGDGADVVTQGRGTLRRGAAWRGAVVEQEQEGVGVSVGGRVSIFGDARWERDGQLGEDAGSVG